jgi:arginyl-tRNA synthetase
MHKRKRDGNATFSRFYMESKVAKNTYICRNLSVPLSGDSISLTSLLQQIILTAISGVRMNLASADLTSTAKLTDEAIPLHRLSDDSCILYRSAIALKLAPLWQLNALDLAHQLTVSFPTINQDSASQHCLDFNIEVVSPGWINLRLSDRGLATWLQQMIQNPPTKRDGEMQRSGHKEASEDAETFPPEFPPVAASPPLGVIEAASSPPHLCPKDSPNLFPVQYAHARCCSLLRMAHGQGLIKLRDLGFNTRSWQLVEPNPIPWLNDGQEAHTEQVCLRLMHLAERRLITQILDWQDESHQSSLGHSVKRCSSLSNDFEKFYSSCRILGEVKTENLKLAQARLGLVGLTQAVLRSLLQDQLGVTAPIEL